MLDLNCGENFLLRRTFFDATGETAIPFINIKLVKCQLMQERVPIEDALYVYNPDSITPYTEGMNHLGDSEFEVEVSKAISELLVPGTLDALWTVDVLNLDFSLDSNLQREITQEQVARVRE